mgnify:CR=1 FL=1
MYTNRRELLQRLEQTCQSLHGDWLGLLILDIQNLQAINRTHGYSCGDALIRYTHSKIDELKKNTQEVANLGNGRFALVYPQLKGPALVSLAIENLNLLFKKPFTWHDQPITIHLNIGATSTNLISDHELLLIVAEDALKKAKNSSQNFHVADIREEFFKHHNLSLIKDFRQALHDNDFELYYQPKISLTDEKILSAEALIRWNHPERGFIPPDNFLTICEQLNLKMELTQWVLNTALRQQQSWPMKQKPSIAINIFADLIDSPELPTVIENVLNLWGADPELLTIEITESAIIDDKDSGFNNLTKIRSLGVKISIDDFGTGYSSLAYFKHIPADELKIDRSFVHKMSDDNNDKYIVGLIINLAKSFNLKIVAEGIETLEQLIILKTLNCDRVQGYYFSKPIPYLNFIEWAKDAANHPPS